MLLNIGMAGWGRKRVRQSITAGRPDANARSSGINALCYHHLCRKYLLEALSADQFIANQFLKLST